MIKRAITTSCITLSILFCFSATAQQRKDIHEVSPAEVMTLINEHRIAIGKRPLSSDAAIAKEALRHSKDMAAGKVAFGHDGFEARVGRLKKRIKPANAWAENVAEGARTAEAVVDMWLHSEMHKENIEGDYNLSGIGIARAKDGTYYYTQIFLLKK